MLKTRTRKHSNEWVDTLGFLHDKTVSIKITLSLTLA